MDRSTAADHLRTLAVVGGLEGPPTDIVLVDDVVTSGATLMGAAVRLAEAYPDTIVRAFAVVRTISDPDDYQQLFDPVAGLITYLSNGRTHRKP